MRDAEFCPRCGSENVEEDPEDSDYTICQVCNYRWTRNNDGDAQTEEEMEEAQEERDEEDEDDDAFALMGSPDNW
jgi:transcription initiation factor TFIIIB Brf1 subunit/transcription initiation factor TFIIB